MLKAINSFFKNENRETQDRFHKHILYINRKEKLFSLEKVFSVLFSFYLLLVCLQQFETCCVLPSPAKSWKMIIFTMTMEYNERKRQKKNQLMISKMNCWVCSYILRKKMNQGLLMQWEMLKILMKPLQ